MMPKIVTPEDAATRAFYLILLFTFRLINHPSGQRQSVNVSRHLYLWRICELVRFVQGLGLLSSSHERRWASRMCSCLQFVPLFDWSIEDLPRTPAESHLKSVVSRGFGLGFGFVFVFIVFLVYFGEWFLAFLFCFKVKAGRESSSGGVDNFVGWFPLAVIEGMASQQLGISEMRCLRSFSLK